MAKTEESLEGRWKGVDSMRELTPEQINFATQQMARWLEIKEQEEYFGRKRKYEDGEFLQLRMDVLHSSLLRRLLSGKEPLEEPPPLTHSYPDYEAVEGRAS